MGLTVYARMGSSGSSLVVIAAGPANVGGGVLGGILDWLVHREAVSILGLGAESKFDEVIDKYGSCKWHAQL